MQLRSNIAVEVSLNIKVEVASVYLSSNMHQGGSCHCVAVIENQDVSRLSGWTGCQKCVMNDHCGVPSSRISQRKKLLRALGPQLAYVAL